MISLESELNRRARRGVLFGPSEPLERTTLSDTHFKTLPALLDPNLRAQVSKPLGIPAPKRELFGIKAATAVLVGEAEGVDEFGFPCRTSWMMFVALAATLDPKVEVEVVALPLLSMRGWLLKGSEL